MASGSIKPGDAVVALPSGRASKVARIVTQDGDLPVAVAGQSVTITLADEIDVSRGDILSSVERQPDVASTVEARLLWTAETDMHPGASYIVKLGARTANATVAKVRHLIDIHTFEPGPGRPLALNEIATAQLRFDRALPISLYRDNRDLGGFILIDRITNETVAFGMIEPGRAVEEEPATEDGEIDWARLGKDVSGKIPAGARRRRAGRPRRQAFWRPDLDGGGACAGRRGLPPAGPGMVRGLPPWPWRNARPTTTSRPTAPAYEIEVFRLGLIG